MLIVIYLGSIAYYFGVVKRLELDVVDRYTRMDPGSDAFGANGVSGRSEDATTTNLSSKTGRTVPEAFTYVVLMATSVTGLVRSKVPVFLVVLHYLVVGLAIGSDSCGDTAGASGSGWFIGYLTCLLLGAFAYRFAASLRVKTGLGQAEHTAWAGNHAVISTLYLLSFVLIRAKPVKCFAGSGLALAYATSVPLLLLVNMYAVVSSYMWLRSYTPQQLVDMNVFPSDNKRD
jgi:hypothetical protein